MKVYISKIFPFVHFGLSVDSVVAAFKRQSEKLRAIADHHDAQADQHDDAARAHASAAEAHRDENFRAHTVADNIDRLIGVA